MGTPFAIYLDGINPAFCENHPGEKFIRLMGRVHNISGHYLVIYSYKGEVELLLDNHYHLTHCHNVLIELESYIPVDSENTSIDIRIPVNFELLKWIEEKRQGKGGLNFKLKDLRVWVAPIQNSCAGKPEEFYIEAPQEGYWSLSRDRWLECLKQFKYNDYEVFELPTYNLTTHPEFRQALDDLKAAEQAFKEGDWQGVFAKSRLAMEAAARVAGKEKDSKDKNDFVTLLSLMFPDPKDENKKNAIDKLMQGFKEVQHLGRHRDALFTNVHREDALLVLRVTFALFEYMMKRIAKNKRAEEQ